MMMMNLLKLDIKMLKLKLILFYEDKIIDGR